MEDETPELSRRQLLAAMAVSSLGGLAKGAGVNVPARAGYLGSGMSSRVITFDAQVSRDGQQRVTVPISIDAAQTVIIVCDMQNDFGAKVACLTEPESTFP